MRPDGLASPSTKFPKILDSISSTATLEVIELAKEGYATSEVRTNIINSPDKKFPR